MDFRCAHDFLLFILYIDHLRSSKPSPSDDVHTLCFLDAIFISQLQTSHGTSVPNKLDDESTVFRALQSGTAVPSHWCLHSYHSMLFPWINPFRLSLIRFVRC